MPSTSSGVTPISRAQGALVWRKHLLLILSQRTFLRLDVALLVDEPFFFFSIPPLLCCSGSYFFFIFFFHSCVGLLGRGADQPPLLARALSLFKVNQCSLGPRLIITTFLPFVLQEFRISPDSRVAHCLYLARAIESRFSVRYSLHPPLDPLRLLPTHSLNRHDEASDYSSW